MQLITEILILSKSVGVPVGTFLFIVSVLAVFAVLSFKSWCDSSSRIESLYKEMREIKETNNNLKNAESSLKNEINKLISGEHEKAKEISSKAEKLFRAAEMAVVERQKGYPYIAESLAEFRSNLLMSPSEYQYLRKRAWKSKEICDALKQTNREINKRMIVAENLVAFYEYVYPDLKEIREQEIDEEFKPDSAYTKSELDKDPDTHFIPKSEYVRLSQCERGQLALDRYWARQKSKKEIGFAYERYIGHLYEKKGYSVTFRGIAQGVNDRGIDLVCENDEEIILVQCKNWARHKKLYENTIFQFFGSVFNFKEEYAKNNSLYEESSLLLIKELKKVKGEFFSTVELSEFAKKALKHLKISFRLKKMDYSYPCIKCNLNNGEKIYHLPFDQQYDRTKICVGRGEFYVNTCKEAEELGFRRARRHFLDAAKPI